MESKGFKLLFVAVSVIAFASLGGVIFMFVKLQNIAPETQASANTDQETAQIVSEVGKYFMLPQGETPDLITVSNLDQVHGQPFFANAALGDKVLVYKQASKAILWRPSIKKIIEAYPINLSAQ